MPSFSTFRLKDEEVGVSGHAVSRFQYHMRNAGFGDIGNDEARTEILGLFVWSEPIELSLREQLRNVFVHKCRARKQRSGAWDLIVSPRKKAGRIDVITLMPWRSLNN